MEWSEQNKYSSFNSYKGLTYYEHYKQIVDWLNGNEYLPPPIECNLDPIAECNLSCIFCITQRYLQTNRAEVGKMRKLPLDYMIRLVDFLSDWGVKGLCISGGGDPSLHKGVPKVLNHSGMETSLFTNGVYLSDELAESLMSSAWVSLSVDASYPAEYDRIKGKPFFDRVISNLTKLSNLRAKSNSDVYLVFKFLILPQNASSILSACKIAKELGLQAFHARPSDFERSDIKGSMKLDFEIEWIDEQFELCHEEETKDFQVFTVTHKFDDKFHVKHDFDSCLATPLVLPILQDGNAYLCVDRKMEHSFKLGSCYPEPETILKWWGSNEHRELVKSVDITKCSRCTWSQYNRQIENVVIKDRMFLKFP